MIRIRHASVPLQLSFAIIFWFEIRSASAASSGGAPPDLSPCFQNLAMTSGGASQPASSQSYGAVHFAKGKNVNCGQFSLLSFNFGMQQTMFGAAAKWTRHARTMANLLAKFGVTADIICGCEVGGHRQVSRNYAHPSQGVFAKSHVFANKLYTDRSPCLGIFVGVVDIASAHRGVVCIDS